ncbi:MAG: hypothetical protein Q8R18_04725 [bacterium]|nr:hypothetical protein [bacterium]
MHPLEIFKEQGIRNLAGPFALNHILEEKRLVYLEQKVGILARSYYGQFEDHAFLISGLVQQPHAKKLFGTFSRLGVKNPCLYPWVSFSDQEKWYKHSSVSLIRDIEVIKTPSLYIYIGDFPNDDLVTLTDADTRTFFEAQLLPQSPASGLRDEFVASFLEAITKKEVCGYDLYYGYKKSLDKDYYYNSRKQKLYRLIRGKLLS